MKLEIERDGKIAAWLELLKLKNGDLEIDYLWTEPEFRNQGLATKLLKKAIAISDRSGHPLVGYIETHKEGGLTDSQEIEWLKKFGFVRVNRYDYGGYFKPVMYRKPQSNS